MEYTELQQNVRILATLGETKFPVISCYLNAKQDIAACRAFLAERIPLLRRTIPTVQRKSFDQSLEHIERYASENAQNPSIRGIVVFVRSVEDPFLLCLRFHVPVSNQLSVDRVPHICQLMALKNIYDRYVVVLMNKERASILEVNLGTVTRQTWSEHPVPPDRIERQWSKERYQRHRRKQTEETIREKIKTLDGLMSAGAHSHLMLAGEPSMVERLKTGLPPHLIQKLVDTVYAQADDRLGDIVNATLSSFVEFRQQQSRTCAAMLQQAVYTNGLGILGTDAGLQCLRHARADVLILAEEYDPGPAWQCRDCQDIQIDRDAAQACPECSSSRFRSIDVKEEMIRLAEGSSCKVTVIRNNAFLIAGGGVGCLTRY
jgi:peptide subunit release factor 1 (eRF1)